MRATVGRIYRFRGIHSLPGFPEPWCYPHQHDYTVEIEADGGTPTDELDDYWGSWCFIDGYDLDSKFLPSTVENIAEQLLVQAGSDVSAVVVWEDRQRWGRAER